jgi:ribosome maturation factor RimP
MKYKKYNQTEKRMLEKATPLAHELGLDIWDVAFEKEGAEKFLRVYIEKSIEKNTENSPENLNQNPENLSENSPENPENIPDFPPQEPEFDVDVLLEENKLDETGGVLNEEDLAEEFDEFEEFEDEDFEEIGEEFDPEFDEDGEFEEYETELTAPGGVTIQDCENLTRPLNKWLDEEDFIDEEYIFEVGSSGLGRKLLTEKHFEKSIGEEVTVSLFKAVDGEKEFTGTLENFGENITVGGKTFPLDKITKVNIYENF